MKPAPFRHIAPATVTEALELLGRHGDAAAVLAGGQSLLPMMNLRMVSPELLIDVMRIDELRTAHWNGDGIELRAGVRQSEVEDDAQVRAAVPLLVEALAHVGYREIRNAGTVCGSAAHADATGEVPAVALALNAEFVLVSARGVRTVPAREFFVSYLQTAREPDELLFAMRLPRAVAGTGSCFMELSPRHGGAKGEFAVVGVALTVTLDGGVISSAAIAHLGVDATARRVDPECEAMLIGQAPSGELFDEVASRSVSDLRPKSDVHASGGYRRHAARVLTRRALARAVERGAL